jgi:hypothetical protein
MSAMSWRFALKTIRLPPALVMFVPITSQEMTETIGVGELRNGGARIVLSNSEPVTPKFACRRWRQTLPLFIPRLDYPIDLPQSVTYSLALLFFIRTDIRNPLAGQVTGLAEACQNDDGLRDEWQRFHILV